MTESTTTFADRWRIAADLADRFHDHLDSLDVGDSLWAKPTDCATLLALHDTCEDVRVHALPVEGENAVTITTSGSHRRLHLWAQLRVCEPADLDVVRSFPMPSRALLLALAGDPIMPLPPLADRRDVVWAQCDGGQDLLARVGAVTDPEYWEFVAEGERQVAAEVSGG